MNERDLLTYPTWERYTVLSHAVFSMSIKDRRNIFQMTRNSREGDDPFFPHHGIAFSEFAVFYSLGEGRRKGKRRPGKKT